MKIESIAIKLLKLITEKSEGKSRPFIVGLSGGQGSGKTTLCQKLEELLTNKKVSCCVLSLDDFYLSKTKRKELADRIHPLAFTRGVPGTHDINLLKQNIIKQVTNKVRWRETMDLIQSQNITQIVELGSGKVLTGIAKRKFSEIDCSNIETEVDLENNLHKFD